MDVPALRRDVDLATGGHGVRGIADEVDHDPGEVFDGEADGRHGGRGGERNLDGGPGDGGQQRVHPAQLGWEVGDRKSARSGWRWSRVGRRQGQDLFHERGGVLGHAFELGGEVAVLRTEDAGGGEQMTVEQEAGEDVAEVMGEAFKTLWLRRGGVGRGCGTGGVDFDKGARSASGPGGCSGSRGVQMGNEMGKTRRGRSESGHRRCCPFTEAEAGSEPGESHPAFRVLFKNTRSTKSDRFCTSYKRNDLNVRMGWQGGWACCSKMGQSCGGGWA